MRPGIGYEEAVRLARERLGDATTQEIAAYVQGAFGLAVTPPMVMVLLGTLREREALERSGRAVREKIERWRAENPQEARRLAAASKSRKAARGPAAEPPPQ